ncbi:MAG: cobalamin B12-binding domain-containing protein [Chloroflexi bacterium]|nr:cobalamin B12-binding domain-containing protein [Chloroflexota bacterium]
MRVLLIEPQEHARVLGLSRFICVEPLALETIAANVALDGHEARILDMRHDNGLEALLDDFDPSVVGITGYTPDAPEMLRIARAVKRHNPIAFVVVGGHHATMCPDDFANPAVDAVLTGDGEQAVRHLCRQLSGQRPVADVSGLYLRTNGHWAASGPEDALETLDTTPHPARDLVGKYRNQYFFWFWDPPVPIETARGCPFRCNYCSVWNFNRGASRFRSTDGVMEELAQLPDGARSVFFADDHFLQHMPRAVALADRIARDGLQLRFSFQTRSDSVVRRPDVIEQWAKAGLFTAFIGFEAARQAELDAMHKSSSVRVNAEAARILHENGVHIWGAFIVDPSWVEADFSQLIDYVKTMRVGFPQFTVMTPLPGTEIFAAQRAQLTTGQHHLFDLAHAVVPTRLPLEKFYEQMARLYAETTMSLSDVKRYIRAGVFPVSALQRAKHVLQQMTDPQSYLAGHDPTVFSAPMRAARAEFRGARPGLEAVPAWAEGRVVEELRLS